MTVKLSKSLLNFKPQLLTIMGFGNIAMAQIYRISITGGRVERLMEFSDIMEENIFFWE